MRAERPKLRLDQRSLVLEQCEAGTKNDGKRYRTNKSLARVEATPNPVDQLFMGLRGVYPAEATGIAFAR